MRCVCVDGASYEVFCETLRNMLSELCVLRRLELIVDLAKTRDRQAMNAVNDSDAKAHVEPAIADTCRRTAHLRWHSPSLTELCLSSAMRLRFPTLVLPALAIFKCVNATVHAVVSVLAHSPTVTRLHCYVPVAETDLDEDEHLDERHYAEANVMLQTILGAGTGLDGCGRCMRRATFGLPASIPDLSTGNPETYLRLSGATLAIVASRWRRLTHLRCSVTQMTDSDLATFLERSKETLRLCHLDQGTFEPVTVTAVVAPSTLRPTATPLELSALRSLSVCVPYDSLLNLAIFPALEYLCCEMSDGASAHALLEACPKLLDLHLASARDDPVLYMNMERRRRPRATDANEDCVADVALQRLIVEDPRRRLAPIVTWLSGSLRQLEIHHATPIAAIGLNSCGRFIPNLAILIYDGGWCVRKTYDLFAPLIIAFPCLYGLDISGTLADVTVYASRTRDARTNATYLTQFAEKLHSLYLRLPSTSPKQPLQLTCRIR
jgi:hypothetical protein